MTSQELSTSKMKKGVYNTNCCVYGCHSRKGSDRNIHFHVFPNKNSGIKVKISNAIGQEELIDKLKAWEKALLMVKPVTKFMRVCSKHFKSEDYCSKDNAKLKQPKLKRFAVPSQNLPIRSLELIKKENNDTEDAFIEDKSSSFSFVKLEPESNSFEFKNFSRNMNMQDILDYSAMDLNSSNDFSFEPKQRDVKVKNTFKIEKSDEIVFDEWKIKNEEVDIKTEVLEQSQNSMLATCFGNEKHEVHLNENENNCIGQETQERNIKNRLTHQIEPGLFKCDHWDYQTSTKSSLKIYFITQKNVNDINIFKCYHCDYRTTKTSHLKRHALQHKNDVNTFKCDHCDYQTFDRSSLSRHTRRQRNPRDVKTIKCDQCDYKTIYKSCLNRHVLAHKNPQDVRMFKCDQCDYQTRYKDGLRRHVLRHKNPEDVNMFKCDQCDYQTLDTSNFKAHVRRHENSQGVTLFKCDHCNYRTINKSLLKRHAMHLC